MRKHIHLLDSLWPNQTSRRVLLERKGDKIVAAPTEDLALAKTYRAFQKQRTAGYGPTDYDHDAPCAVPHGRAGSCAAHIGSRRIWNERSSYGPKKVYDEYVDGKLVTSKGPGEKPTYDGRVADRPIVDFNYEITTYTFTEPGLHTIQWKGGGIRLKALWD